MKVMQTQNSSPMTFEERLRAVWEHCQRGLVYAAPCAIFATFWMKEGLTRERLSDLLDKVRKTIHDDSELCSRHTTAILGVSFRRWEEICQKEHLPLPKGMTLHRPQAENPHSSKAFPKSHGKFKDSGADLWFHIKSHEEAACKKVFAFIVQELASETTKYFDQDAASTSNQKGDNNGKVLGCRFSENLNNPSDPISLAKHTLIGGEDMDHFGGSFVLAQRFLINWNQIHSMTEQQIEDLIGRKTDDTIIPGRDSRSHIILSRIQDDHGNTTPILRLGLPFGKAKTNPKATAMTTKSVTQADEEGIYYAGFSKSAAVLEKVMTNQIGANEGFMNDRLMNHVYSDLGGLYYIPSVNDLKLDVTTNDFSYVEEGDWSRFPGVDWNRIIRHYRTASDNGLMYYNHQHYLFAMATGIDRRNDYFKAPSPRILSLLEGTFRLWQDNWYFNRKQEEIPGDLSYYLNQYKGKDKPADIMRESIMIRKGWAIRMSLNLFTSKEYGFRGRRILHEGKLKPYSADTEETVICGSGTYHISPEEIIVGGMPNLTLGEGRYVMKYLSEQERHHGFVFNLSEASGVGHVIPNFEKALQKGLKGLMEEVKTYEFEAQDNQIKRDLYTSSYLALQGISEYCINYSKLAEEMEKEMTDDQQWEKNNLREIAARMKKLSTEKPDTFVEALQLIFTIHCALHLNGEPTALGRLDQLLEPFYQKGDIRKHEAQEAIEAFYIKLDEKVQQNRIYMEDHQPFGNLAMGGSAGPYPQGASLGQWIQQLTVGGTVANGATPSKPAYNDVTRMFIKASGKLPLNAPCLSLRTRKDIPEDILKDAAHAILSGGAHPILLNDEMLIQGLHTSGDGVGGDLSEEAKTNWNSSVSLKSAQNYACDGCYEPQFPGENWFSLGGFSTLQPLECAINRGKTYSPAGQAYLYGKRVSLETKPAEEIKSFDELLDLYYMHFDWLNRKNFANQLASYGSNTAFCPSPILNVLVDDCLAKGQDLYAGGAKYNVYGPCYISLSSTINSLYAIKMMVFDEKNAVTTLEELLECLCCDWGYFMTEPFISKLAGEGRLAARSDRFKRLRQVALSLPRYGRGNADIDDFGNAVVERIATLSIKALTEPWPLFKDTIEKMAKAFGTSEHKFGLQIQPGVGTFENHVEMGSWNGASADGRRNGTTVASDLSASPSPADLPIDHQYADFKESLKGFKSRGTAMYSDGAPTDYNIDENYPADKLVEVLKQFVKGESSNVLTITVANPDTFNRAVDSPEQFDLLRVRTGGWSTFFTSVFPVVQEQHLRRPVSVPETKKNGCPYHNNS